MRVSKLLGKISARLFFYFSVLLLISILAAQLKPVQTYLTKKFLVELSKVTDHEATVSSVKIAWLDRVELKDFLILDRKSDTLAFADRILVNYKITDLLNSEFLSVEEIQANQLRLKLVKHDSLSALNLSELIKSLKNPNKKSRPINVEEVFLTNVDFSIDNNTVEKIESRLDVAHLSFDFSEIQFANFLLNQDTIEMDVIHVNGVDLDHGLELTELSSRVEINNQSLSLTELNLRTPSSQISDSIKFYYHGIENLSHFIDSVSFGLYFSNSVISERDLKIITGVESVKSPIKIDGTIWGKVGDFNMDNSRIGFGNESFIEGGISSYGLPNLKSTFLLADIIDSHIIPEDIEPYVGELSENIAQLGRVDFTGSFAGFLNDFVARGDFVTEKGSVHSDINLKIPEDPNDMKYSGNLELIEVDLGAFFNNKKLVQQVSMKGQIDGEGITPKNANFDLNAKIYNSGFYGYSYDSITADGTFASKFFNGTFEIDDPNCQVKGNANLDFNLEEEILRVDLNMDSTHLNELNLVLDTLVTGGTIRVDIVNLDLDQFTGTAQIDSGFVKVNNNKVLVDSIKFTATLEDGLRNLELTLPGVNAKLTGDFKVTQAIRDLSALVSDYTDKLQLSKDSTELEEGEESYKLELFAQFDNLSRYLDSLRIPLEVPDGSFLEATFRESKNANLFMYAQADYLKFGKNVIHNPVFELNSSREIGSNELLTNFILESDQQKFSAIPETENLLIEGIWLNNRIDLTTLISQETTKSKMRFETSALLSSDSILIKMKPSNIIAFDDTWKFNPENKVTVYPNTIKIENFSIYDETESIEINGIYSAVDATNIDLAIKDLDLEKGNLFTDLNLNGLLKGKLTVFRETARQPFQFEGGFDMSDLTLNNFLIGDITGTSEWDSRERNIFTQVKVDRENFNSIDLSGYYYPFNIGNQLDFQMKFENADLQIAEQFLKENISGLVGYADGRLNLQGSLAEPEISGRCTVSKGNVRINYLNTLYTFEGPIVIEPGSLRFDSFNLTDRKGAQSVVSGTISHDFFSDLITDIQINAENFEFLNTTATDNSLYYGTANGTGVINLTGPLNDLLIKASMKTENDTRLFVPITEGGEVSQQDYITFLDFSDTTQVVEEDKYNFQGITIDFDIEVTPEAYCELIFDIKTGDIIRGRGRGNLKLSLDTDGEFHMFGPLEITDGAYNFTVPGFINKEFQVVPGSRVTWFGDPYNGTIDLNAIYLQRADFTPLLTEGEDDGGEAETRVGVNVMLNLSEGILSPSIDFDLQLQDKIDETSWRLSKLTQISSNEQELKRQVISLLFFRRFSPQSSFALSGGGNVGNSVSEFFSNQVSYLVSQLDENLEVEVDLASLDGDAFNTFQLRLAYTFLDGRLKVTSGSDFNNAQTQNDRLVGDWSVEYSLTKDGRLRAKVFRATNQQLSANRGDQNFETGVSLRFVHSFNEFKELLTSSRKAALKRSQQESKSGAATGDLDTTY